VDGKLELSMKSYLELVLANSTDITIQRLSVETNRNAITRAFGPFDPLAIARFSATRVESQSTSAINGASSLNSLTQPLSLGFTQLLQTGTTFNINYANTKSSSNSTFATFNPSYSSTMNFNFSQPLLRGRGAFITRIPIMVARSRLRGAEYTFEDQLLQIVSGAEQAYWSVVGARENLRVAEQGLNLADQALKRAKRELELGASSPLDIFQPEQQFAQAQLQLTQARFAQAQSEDVLRRQMGADLGAKYRAMPIVLTEAITVPPDAGTIDREKYVETALTRRPDLRAVRQNLDVDDLNIKATNNALRPNLALTGQYGSSGTGGVQTIRNNVFGGGSEVVGVIPGGITDALSQLFGFGQPTYGFGLSLSLPVKNHAAAADYADALVNKKLDAMRVRVAEQNARLGVLTAITNLENSKASVELAKVARDLAQKRVDAEQKKYELGTEVIFFVLSAETDLTAAEGRLVTETINYRLNQIALLRQLGTLLEERGIAVQ
jgi:outer membrane protein TolC